MHTFILWIILAIISLPLALLILIIYPIVWLLLLPFRLVGFSVGIIFNLLKTIILLPLKILRLV
ncbi:MAG: hypothetical protein V3V16_09895 [Melioribacteraceae bacterium]